MPTNGLVEITRVTMPSIVTPHAWVFGAVLRGDRIEDQTLWLPAPIRSVQFPEPRLSVTTFENILEISSPTFCHAVHVDDRGHELLSEYYFDLLPGVPK